MRPLSRRTFLQLSGAGALTGALATSVPKLAGTRSAGGAGQASGLLTPANAQAALEVLGRAELRHPDSLPYPHLPPGTDTMPQIRHFVMLMMENHSYDNFIGTLNPVRANGTADGFSTSPAAVTSWNPNGVIASNPNGHGEYQYAFHMPTTCQHSGSPTQQWSASHEQYDHGRQDGFVTCVSYGASAPAGPVGMAYWNADDLPVLHNLCEAFPIGDRFFQSVLGQTDPNRRFLIAGTSAGMTDDIDISTSGLDERAVVQDATLPVPANGTIFDRLSSFGISFTNYTASYPTGTTAELYPEQDAAPTALTEKAFDDFYADCASGSLPSFSFLDENYDTQSQENPQDIVVGEQLVHDVVTALASSPAWSSTLLIVNYDEHGGYFDHVPPPVALPPDAIPPVVEPGQQLYDGFGRYGFRVPAVVVSPYSRPNWVTHTVHDHTSILAMIERKWNLPAMTYRDANANDLTDFLDMEALAKRRPRNFEEYCPRLAQPAPSKCPGSPPALPLPGTTGPSREWRA